MTAFIDLQRTGLPGPVVIACGWVWVVVGNLYRINPRTNRIVGPRFEFGGDIGSLVPAAGALWVTNANGGSVSRIDLRTGASAALNPAVWSKITDIDASGAGSLWMSGTNVVDRVDPVSGRTTAAIFLPGVDRVYFWRNSAWALTSSSAGTASIVRVDPATNKVTGQAVRLGSGPEAVAAGPTGIWAVNIGDQQLLHIVLRTIGRG